MKSIQSCISVVAYFATVSKGAYSGKAVSLESSVMGSHCPLENKTSLGKLSCVAVG